MAALDELCGIQFRARNLRDKITMSLTICLLIKLIIGIQSQPSLKYPQAVLSLYISRVRVTTRLVQTVVYIVSLLHRCKTAKWLDSAR